MSAALAESGGARRPRPARRAAAMLQRRRWPCRRRHASAAIELAEARAPPLDPVSHSPPQRRSARHGPRSRPRRRPRLLSVLLERDQVFRRPRFLQAQSQKSCGEGDERLVLLPEYALTGNFSTTSAPVRRAAGRMASAPAERQRARVSTRGEQEARAIVGPRSPSFCPSPISASSSSTSARATSRRRAWSDARDIGIVRARSTAPIVLASATHDRPLRRAVQRYHRSAFPHRSDAAARRRPRRSFSAKAAAPAGELHRADRLAGARAKAGGDAVPQRRGYAPPSPRLRASLPMPQFFGLASTPWPASSAIIAAVRARATPSVQDRHAHRLRAQRRAPSPEHEALFPEIRALVLLVGHAGRDRGLPASTQRRAA